MKPPTRNLSPLAEPWGRWAEESINFLGKQADRIGLDGTNDGRNNNASFDVLASQIQEIQSRSTISSESSPIVINVPDDDDLYFGSTSFTLPAPDARRWGVFNVFVRTPNYPGVEFALYALIKVNDLTMISALSLNTNFGGAVISADALTGSGAQIVGPGAPVQIDCQIGLGASGGTGNFTVPPVSASVSYAQRA